MGLDREVRDGWHFANCSRSSLSSFFVVASEYQICAGLAKAQPAQPPLHELCLS